MLTPSDVMFELIDPDDIHLNLNIYEKDIDKLFIGQNLLAYSNAQPDKKYECEIMLISKDISDNGSTEVHCHFENYHKSLIPGMYMNAEIQVSSKASATLPEESIVNFEGKDFVFVETAKQKFEMHEVKKGNAENGFVEILNASEMPNQTFVTKGAYTLLMKLKNNEEE